jgi:SAM-dependent methyltransferase
MNIHRIYGVLFKTFRVARMRRFLEQIAPRTTESILDLGGTLGSWLPYLPVARRLVLLNVPPLPALEEKHREMGIEVVAGDACSLPYHDREFDVVFSNSVIEHVGAWDRQVAFAREARRVGRRLWVQTPAWEFPIEPHYLTPCVQYLPKAARMKLARNFTVWGWLVRPEPKEVAERVENTRLLRAKEMEELFPGCQVLRERCCLLTKSYIACRI